MKLNIDEIVAEYKKEYTRTTGKTVEVLVKGAWVYITGTSGIAHKYKRAELPEMIGNLKSRPTFGTDGPTTNTFGEQVTLPAINTSKEGDWLVVRRGKTFLGYFARNGWSGKTAFCGYKIGEPVIGQLDTPLSLAEMKLIVKDVEKYFG